MPDPIFNTIGATHGYPSLTAGNWHMQNTMDVGDVDNDGIADVAIIGYQSRGVAVALGGVNGDLSSSVLFDVGSGADVRPQAVVLSDLDQDGFLDIAVASILATGTQTAYISWLRGNGDGSFESAQSIPGVTSLVGQCNDPRAISAPDLDNDGRPELAILCYNTPASVINIARRHTNGNWILQSNATINASGAANGTIMKWGRLTSATGLDVVVGGHSVATTIKIINDVSLTVNNATTGSFTVASSPGSYLPLYGYVADVDIADLNADGYGDLLLSTQTQSGTVSHWGGVYYTCLSTGTAGTCTLQGWGWKDIKSLVSSQKMSIATACQTSLQGTELTRQVSLQ